MRNGKVFAAKAFCFFLALGAAVGMGQALSNWRIDRLAVEEITALETGPAPLPDSTGGEVFPAESLPGFIEADSLFAESDTAAVSVFAPESSSAAESASFAVSSTASSAAVSSSAADSKAASSAAQSTPTQTPPAVSPTPLAGAVNPYSCWYYDRLSAEQQLLYCEMYAFFSGYEPETEITHTAVENVNPAFKALRFDHPELFWLDQYTYYSRTPNGGSEYAWKLERNDYMDRATRDAFAVQIEQEKNAILAAMNAALPANASQTAKAQFLFEYLALHTTYVTGSPYNQSMASCLVNRESVCAGYARAYQYILSELGIFCTYISGYGHGESHAWSLVQLDGGWYYSDSTWGDTDQVMKNGYEKIAYEYFAQPYDWFCLTHTPDEDIWPRTTDTAADWFRRNGALLESWDEARVEQLLRTCTAERRPMLQLCFTTAAGLQTGINAAQDPAIHDLFERVAGQTALVHPEIVYYNYDDERLTLLFPLSYEG